MHFFLKPDVSRDFLLPRYARHICFKNKISVLKSGESHMEKAGNFFIELAAGNPVPCVHKIRTHPYGISSVNILNSKVPKHSDIVIC